MFLVIVHVLGVYEDIVEVDDYEEVDHIMEYIVHEGLESGWRVCHTEGHDEVFVRSVASTESRLPFVTLGDAYVVVSRSQVDFSENSSVAKAVE